jgi:hypothetical protein
MCGWNREEGVFLAHYEGRGRCLNYHSEASHRLVGMRGGQTTLQDRSDDRDPMHRHDSISERVLFLSGGHGLARWLWPLYMTFWG